MRLCENLYVVAGGTAGVGISCDSDCNIYLINCGDGYVLIDCGCGVETERLATNIKAHGFSLRDCRAILLTHAHADHAAGAHWLCEATGAEVLALPQSAAYLRQGDRTAIALDAAIATGIYPEKFAFPSCEAREIEDGATLTFGKVAFTAVATPGHCSGHCSFLADIDGLRTLFAGDCVFPGGTIALQAIWDCSISDYIQSIDKLASLAIDALIPSHHGFCLSGGRDHIGGAAAVFRKLAIPPNA